MPKRPVTVNVDFSPIVVQNGVPAGTPNWDPDPDTVQCHNGHNEVEWTLVATNIPAGFSASFPATGGIVFSPNNDPLWPGADPVLNNGKYKATDNFQNQATTVGYEYTISVELTNTNTTTGYNFSYDPDVDNVSGDGR